MASPTAHARLSPSSADRWIHCPGSVALSEQLPPQEDTFYTREGTAAHEYADITLRRTVFGKKSISVEDKRKYKAIKAGEYYSEEMEEAAETYAGYIQELFAAAGRDAVLMTEQRLDLTPWIPEGFGQSDAVVIGNDTIHVIDYKYGKGVPVSAEKNPQLRLYALGAVNLFSDIYDFRNVQTVIIQPRIGSITTEEMTVEELHIWGDTVVKPQAEKAYNGSDEFADGSWCNFCPAYDDCKVQYALAYKAAQMDFADPMLMTDEDTEWVLEKADAIISWLKSVQESALQEALNGKHFNGYKIVEGRSVRKYSDPLKAAEWLNKAGFEDALIYERNLLGLTALTKVIGKKQIAEMETAGLIVKPEGKPTLVPESDRREAMNTLKKAADDFNE